MSRKRTGFFDKSEIRLNGDTGLIKLIAMLTMLTDHLGAVVFTNMPILRIIGRIAFPVYAYCIAAGAVYTRSMGRYLHRLAITALLVQPLYVVAMKHTNEMMYLYSFSEEPLKAAYQFYLYSWRHPSIFLTLLLGGFSILCLKERKYWLLVLIAIMITLTKQAFPVDYGLKGVILIVLFYAFIDRWYLSLPVVLAFMVWWGLQGSRYSMFGVHFSTQMYAVLSLPLIYIPMNTGIRAPKWVYYAFYPVHLGVILLIRYWDVVRAFIAR